MKPIALTIAGSDSSGGAGIQADLKTFASLGVHGCCVITAITAQNNLHCSYVEYMQPEGVQQQLSILQNNLLPKAIKLGMLGNISCIEQLIKSLSKYQCDIVLDPVLMSSSGKPLYLGEASEYIIKLTQLFPLATVVTPNIPEAEQITGLQIASYEDVKLAAKQMLHLGVKSVLIKGGHGNTSFCHDYWTDGNDSFWLSSKRHGDSNYRGTGCVLSSAIAATLSLGYELKDAIVIAKMYVNESIRNTDTQILSHQGWPEQQIDLPYLFQDPVESPFMPFAKVDRQKLEFYPIVDNSASLANLLQQGIQTIQIRIKNKSGIELENNIHNSIALAKKYHAQLFVNDYWELAIKHNAYGVHLGQEDLTHANIIALRKSGLRLGISTHCYYEVARAHTFAPSYIACGPIFHTNSKSMPFAPQGIANLQRWRKTLTYPLIAIGGINAGNLDEVVTTKVDGVAMISAIESVYASLYQRELRHA